jgi:hypothetical protein
MGYKTLYEEKREGLHVVITAEERNGGALVIAGHDLGEIVKSIRGDDDYEYYLTVSKDEVQKLIHKISTTEGVAPNFSALLDWLAARYNDEYCFGKIQELLKEMGVDAEFSCW